MRPAVASLGAGHIGPCASVLGKPLKLQPWEAVELPAPLAKMICEKFPAYTYLSREEQVFKHKLRVVV